MSRTQNRLISELLTLSIKAERTASRKVAQVAKMKAGKVRKQLKESEIKYY